MVGDVPVRITKGVTLEAGSSTLEIAYLLEGLPQDRPLHFAVEFNFAGLPAGADDRYFYDARRPAARPARHAARPARRRRAGPGRRVAGHRRRTWRSRGPTGIWTFPIETVSQSEGGFELVHQSVVVLPHWLVQADADGRWTVTMHLAIDTALAESRQETSRWRSA